MGDCPVFFLTPLMRFLMQNLVLRCFLILLSYLKKIFFFHLWWCLLPIFPTIRCLNVLRTHGIAQLFHSLYICRVCQYTWNSWDCSIIFAHSVYVHKCRLSPYIIGPMWLLITLLIIMLYSFLFQKKKIPRKNNYRRRLCRWHSDTGKYTQPSRNTTA